MDTYLKLENEIKRINRKLDYYAKNPIAGSHGVVRGSMKNFPYAESHFVVGAPDVKNADERNRKIRQLFVDLSDKKEKYEDFQLEIDLAIEQIEDIETRQILQYKYINKWTDAKIGKELGYDRSTITKKINNFFTQAQTQNIKKDLIFGFNSCIMKLLGYNKKIKRRLLWQRKISIEVSHT